MEISFTGIIVAARSTVDGGWRISIDLGYDESEKVIDLIAVKDQLVQFAAIPMPSSGAI